MKVELLHLADCPNIDAARQLLKEALRELELPEEIAEVEVCDTGEAEAQAFPGSPTIRVDGKDVEAMFPAHGGYGLACRTYVIDGTRYGVPSAEMIRDAMRSAVALTDRER
jgi:Domain of unknown function (DUF2703)